MINKFVKNKQILGIDLTRREDLMYAISNAKDENMVDVDFEQY